MEYLEGEDLQHLFDRLGSLAPEAALRVFAARSWWRALVTPKPPDGVARRNKPKACTDAPTAKA